METPPSSCVSLKCCAADGGLSAHARSWRIAIGSEWTVLSVDSALENTERAQFLVQGRTVRAVNPRYPADAAL